MSYVTQQPNKPERPPRPIGVTVIAGLGILLGVLYTVYTVVLLVMRLLQGQPVAALFGTIGGFLIGSLIVSFYLGLWQMARWSWFVHIVLNGAIAFGAYYMLSHITQIQAQVSLNLPDQFANPLNTILRTGAMVSFVVSLLIAVYLLLIFRAFKIGVREERQPWER